MLPQPGPVPPSPRRFGVGIDTSRYGHDAAFLPDDKRALALYSFSVYGRWAFYGSFGDTTKVRAAGD